MGEGLICPTGAPSKILSSGPAKNISLHGLVETALWIPPSRPSTGAFRDRHERWAGMRWTRQRLAYSLLLVCVLPLSLHTRPRGNYNYDDCGTVYLSALRLRPRLAMPMHG